MGKYLFMQKAIILIINGLDIIQDQKFVWKYDDLFIADQKISVVRDGIIPHLRKEKSRQSGTATNGFKDF
jgi:hypothetical protein